MTKQVDQQAAPVKSLGGLKKFAEDRGFLYDGSTDWNRMDALATEYFGHSIDYNQVWKVANTFKKAVRQLVVDDL